MVCESVFSPLAPFYVAKPLRSGRSVIADGESLIPYALQEREGQKILAPLGGYLKQFSKHMCLLLSHTRT